VTIFYALCGTSGAATRPLIKRYRRRAHNDVFEKVFGPLSHESDLEYAFIDSTIIKVHRHAAGAKRGTQNRAIGKSRGVWPPRSVALVDALGTWSASFFFQAMVTRASALSR
jgi:hypothetical protein